VLDAWGLGGSADLDRNGTVEARDVALLLDNWGVCAP
jgi:hypothetical protein